jgi:SAM-dependent methyltransferase
MRQEFQIRLGRRNPQIMSHDAYGAELWDYYTTKQDKREVVERDDHFIANNRDGYGGRVYFSDYKDWTPVEQKAIAHAWGRVLDVGCGAGRHALYLQKKGLDVRGIDASPLAIRICKLRGLKKAQILSFDHIDRFPVNSFDTVVMMGNNFGLFGGFRKAKILLRETRQDHITKGHHYRHHDRPLSDEGAIAAEPIRNLFVQTIRS